MSQYALYDSMQAGCADLFTLTCPVCRQRGWITIGQSGADALMDGVPVHRAVPALDPRLREQITSGIHPRCFPGAEFGDGIDSAPVRP